MHAIPTINIVAAVHLSFIAIFIGMYMVEAVIELYPAFSKGDVALHHGTIRLHFWIDILVELPVMSVVIATGITMAVLVDKLTALHIVKISSVAMFVLIAVWCPVNVIRRHIQLKNNEPEETLRKTSKVIIATAAVSMAIFFTTAFILGFWLAYHRILGSIYS
jgi:hypothetical protein